jgi:hypothetical protein
MNDAYGHAAGDEVCAPSAPRGSRQPSKLPLVNNAGIRLYQTVVEASAESWDTL